MYQMDLVADTWTLGAWHGKSFFGANTMLRVFSQTTVTSEVIAEAFILLFQGYTSLL